jgi:hypothetical protein
MTMCFVWDFMMCLGARVPRVVQDEANELAAVVIRLAEIVN